MRAAICTKTCEFCYEGAYCVTDSRDAVARVHGKGALALRELLAREGPFTGCPCIPEPGDLDEEV
jgi:hypothetical protein